MNNNAPYYVLLGDRTDMIDDKLLCESQMNQLRMCCIQAATSTILRWLASTSESFKK